MNGREESQEWTCTVAVVAKQSAVPKISAVDTKASVDKLDKALCKLLLGRPAELIHPTTAEAIIVLEPMPD